MVSGFVPAHRAASHWSIALPSIGEPRAVKLAFLIEQLVGAGASCSGTMIRSAQEHGPVWLLNAYCPSSVPPASRLWSEQLTGDSSVLPPWLGTMTSEHGWCTPQSSIWFSRAVRTSISTWPVPFGAVVA